MVIAVTNRKLVSSKEFLNVVEQIAASEVDRIILREKDLSDNELYSLAVKVKQITDKYSVPLSINSSIKVAQGLGCRDVHLPYHLFQQYKDNKGFRFGVSIHSIEEAIYAENQGADYVLAGHIFPTKSKLGLRPRGISFIGELAKNIHVPIIAIGGINLKNVRSVYDAGASGVAVMSLLMTPKDVGNKVHKLRKV